MANVNSVLSNNTNVLDSLSSISFNKQETFTRLMEANKDIQNATAAFREMEIALADSANKDRLDKELGLRT
jgi:hypothetical protein